uniref:Ig-like domain-containing protein n=1 Tax=Leptobrachium leishanense TaxID=445787 RepID=A0A8C5PCV7_9ANUR
MDVKWQKNGMDVPSHEAKHVFPNSDGTYQIRVTVEVAAEDREGHSCHVDHASLDQTLTVKWEPQSSSNTLWIVIAFLVGVTAIAAVVGFIIWKKRSGKKTNYAQTNTPQTAGIRMKSLRSNPAMQDGNHIPLYHRMCFKLFIFIYLFIKDFTRKDTLRFLSFSSMSWVQEH